MSERVSEALEMLEAFVSVETRCFDLMQTNSAREGKYCRLGLNDAAMRMLLPHAVPRAAELRYNLILGPRPSPGIALAQLDDLDPARLARARPIAFLCVETSPQNYQAWVAMRGANRDFVKRLMRGVGSDMRARGYGRVAGSLNCKPAYAPDFPVVSLVAVDRERIWMPADLEGFAAAPLECPVKPPIFYAKLHGSAGRGWPDYERCLRGAPETKDGEQDRSRADFLWCKWALERGHSPSAVESKLMSVSEKARSRSEKYARDTVTAAQAAVQ